MQLFMALNMIACILTAGTQNFRHREILMTQISKITTQL
jgi:hypothetical protein